MTSWAPLRFGCGCAASRPKFTSARGVAMVAVGVLAVGLEEEVTTGGRYSRNAKLLKTTLTELSAMASAATVGGNLV